MVCGSFNAEGDIVSERVVEQYGLLVNVADEAAKVVDAEVLDVDAIDEHLAFLHVVVSWNKIDEGRFAASALSH